MTIITPKTEKGRLKLEQEFLEAVIEGNIDVVKECLKKGVDPNFISEENLSALHIVSETGHRQMAQVLLDAPGINLNIMSDMDMTPLMIASFYSTRGILQELLKRGADPNFPNKNGNRALHYACMNSDMKIVFDLVTHGANVKVRNVFDVTPLTIAAIDRHSPVITRYLLRKGAHQKASKEFPLLLECALACSDEERLDIFKSLIKHGLEINQVHPLEKRNCLHYVAMTGYEPLAAYLLSAGINHQQEDATGRTPLQIAADHRHLGIVKLIRGWQKKKVNFVDLATEIK
nr:ankyrin-3-like [Leptinotarsa decemlineata]